MAEKPRIKIFVVVVLTLALIALIVLSMVPDSPLLHLTSPLGKVFNPIVRLGQTVTRSVSGWISSVSESDKIRRDNEDLREEIARLQNELAAREDAAKQFEELKDAFGLPSLFPDMTIKGGYIMNRAIGDWYDAFRINLGQKDGILVRQDRSFAVVDANSNLVGRVLSSDLDSAKVLPIIHEGFATGARMEGSHGVALRVRGDLTLKDDNLIYADQIPLDASVAVGDRIVTSGAGGVFPEGLPIGTIEEIHMADDQRSLEATVRPAVSFNRLTAVFVLIGG
ncbi:MAG TPA: rod shape-determining protein MreC [Fastidiosipila sp.]|jgi:rod shape-determining protein MreC|nr:rod shape-determining protein MreC [Fastidiosipila sp.]